MRRGVRSSFSNRAARWIRKPACSIRTVWKPARCDRRRRRTTIATSPIPDLLPLVFDDAFVADCRATLPELPDTKRARYVEQLGISPYNAQVLTADQEAAAYFELLLNETALKQGEEPAAVGKAAANWVISDLFGALNGLGKGIADSPISAAQGAELLALVADGTLSGRLAKDVFAIMVETGEDPAKIVDERGLKQVSDTGAIEAEIARVLDANADKVAEYRAGKDKLFGFFVGQTMKATKGQANPAVVNDLLKKALG